MFQRYYSNLFIATMVEAGSCRLFAQVVKNRRVIKTFEAIFDNEDEDSIDKKVLDYIKEISKDYKETYLAFCLNSIGQGAFNGLEFDKNSVDENSVTSLKTDNNWTIYASYIDINWAKDMFKPVNLDLLYSPFVFLHEEIQKRDVEEKPILYIYSFQDSFALGIFEQKELLYGAYFKTKQKTLHIEDIDEKPYEDLDKISEIEPNVVKNEDEYESFDDLDDTLEFEIDDDIFENIDEEKSVNEEATEGHTSIEHFGRDMTMYNYIIDSIREFYDMKGFKDKFIDDVVVYDDCEASNTVVNMLKDEQFMNVDVVEVKALKDMCNLAVKDIGL